MPQAAGSVEFWLLGPPPVDGGEAPLPPTPRGVLADLLMRANQATPLDTPIGVLRDDKPPSGARTT